MLLNNIGLNLSDQHNYAKAEEYYIRYLSICEKLAYENPYVYNPALAVILGNISINYSNQDNPTKAEIYHMMSLEVGGM